MNVDRRFAVALIAAFLILTLIVPARASRSTLDQGRRLLFEGAGTNFPYTGCFPSCEQAFSSGGVNYDIWTVDEDGSGLRNLTASPGVDGNARWSPNGERVVFASNRDGDFDLYVIAQDGSGLKQLTNDPGDETYPEWSPDGRRLVFTSLQSRHRELTVMRADGSGRRPLGAFSDPGDYGLATPEAGAASWSPDGRWIAFVKSTDDGDGEPHTGQDDIYVVRADGRRVRAVATTSFDEKHPDWSPDGKWITFTRDTRDGSADIASVRPDRTGFRWLTRTDEQEWDPSWSADGRTVAFVVNEYVRSGGSWVAADSDVWTMEADGSNRTRLLLKPDTYDYGVDWQPTPP